MRQHLLAPVLLVAIGVPLSSYLNEESSTSPVIGPPRCGEWSRTAAYARLERIQALRPGTSQRQARRADRALVRVCREMSAAKTIDSRSVRYALWAERRLRRVTR